MNVSKRYLTQILQSGFITLLFFVVSINTIASNFTPIGAIEINDNYTEYKGVIVDSKSGASLAFANLTVQGTNISTIANSDGEFVLKIPHTIVNPKAVVSFIGFKNRIVELNNLENERFRIKLDASPIELPELSVVSKDAEGLIRAVLNKKEQNYPDYSVLMTAFYREVIKKSRTNASLSEAVIEVHKQPYNSYKDDIARLYKARKKADYSKLDTIVFKLQGGPYNNLFLDIMKNNDLIFSEEMLPYYEFSFDKSTYIDNRLVFVIDFKQRVDPSEPLYYGKLYIDAESLALKSAVFKLNISNRDRAAQMFIVKKPFNARVYPYETNYRVDYVQKAGKWYFNYSRIEFGIKINWKKKLFNTNYISTIEMAVTDWAKTDERKPISTQDRLSTRVILSDEASGFSDPQFWGEYNIIEPEKSIETAIKKIQKQLEKEKQE